MTIDQLTASMLVTGAGSEMPEWNERWRRRLVSNLDVLVRQLWAEGISQIFIDGSFVEAKVSPGDIDGYFVCSHTDILTGQLAMRLNRRDPHRVWTWDEGRRTKDLLSPQWKLPMWHRYHVELWPEYGQFSGIRDEFGHDQKFPAAFRKSRDKHQAKGIIRLMQ